MPLDASPAWTVLLDRAGVCGLPTAHLVRSDGRVACCRSRVTERDALIAVRIAAEGMLVGDELRDALAALRAEIDARTPAVSAFAEWSVTPCE